MWVCVCEFVYNLDSDGALMSASQVHPERPQRRVRECLHTHTHTHTHAHAHTHTHTSTDTQASFNTYIQTRVYMYPLNTYMQIYIHIWTHASHVQTRLQKCWHTWLGQTPNTSTSHGWRSVSKEWWMSGFEFARNGWVAKVDNVFLLLGGFAKVDNGFG